MRTEDAIEEFESVSNIAEILGISVQAVYKWGGEVPPLRAYQLREKISQRNEQNKEALI